MISFLLDFNTCAFAGSGVNANNWIGINMLVVLLFFSIAALIYALSNLLPPSPREKLKTTSKFEIMQMILSIFIIIILVGLASLSCNFTNSIAGMDPFEAAQIYIGKLIFADGINLATHIYSTSIEFMIGSEIFNILFSPISRPLLQNSVFNLTAGIAPSFGSVYNTYADIVVSYNALVILTTISAYVL
jgi:heme/copper-type cytochrome/quinol oxidase subunit 2